MAGGLSSPWQYAILNAGLGMLDSAGQGQSTGQALAAGGRGALAGLDYVRQAGAQDRAQSIDMARLNSDLESAAVQRQRYAAEMQAAQAAAQQEAAKRAAMQQYAARLGDPGKALEFQLDPTGYLGAQRQANAPLTLYQQAQLASDQAKLGLDREKFAFEQTSGGGETTAALRTRRAKIQDAMRLHGIDEATATAVVDGQYRTVTDPVRGTSVNQNMLTGETAAIDFPRQQVPGLGQPTPPVSIPEMAGEIGAVPFAEDVLSKTLGQFVPSVVNEARTKAATQLGFVKRMAQSALGTTSRPSIWEQQEINALFPSKGIYDSEQRANYQLNQLRDMVEFTHNEYAKQINARALPVEQENELRGKMAELQSLHQLLPPASAPVAQQAMPEGRPQAGGGQQQQVQQAPTPELQQRATGVQADWPSIVETARKHGLTPEEVIQRLEQSGG